ncbi:MAG: hypothetical protein RL088_3770 [Verrucomicrobiota bacterium]|jgi:ATP-binding cassette subfamily B protein/subfamily B ATP-binding cassette protein MsbA
MSLYFRSLQYLRPYWRGAVFSVILIFVASAAALLAPWPMQVLVDHVLAKQPLPSWLEWLPGWVVSDPIVLIATVAGSFLLLHILGDVIGIAESYVNTKLELGMARDFRGDLFLHAQRLSLSFHDHRRSGMLIYAINSQADSVAGVVMVVPGLAQSVFTLVGMFWVTFTMDSTLALLALSVVPFLYYSVGFYVNHIQKRLMEVKMMEGDTLSIIHEAMSMLRVIVAFGREKHEHRRFQKQSGEAMNARVKLTVKQTLFGLAVGFITAVGTALVLGFGAHSALQGKMTVGQLLVVLAYIAAIYKPLETISTTIGGLQDRFAELRIAFGLLDTKPEIQDAPDAKPLTNARGEVTFEGVSFSYTGRDGTLRDISFTARAGEVVALVGPTGAGKTTLISLIPRFYDPAAGRVLLDGQDIRSLTLESVRAQVSIVLQEPLLFSGSIAENIRYGRLDASREEIIAAAQNANAHDFISRLPKGYDTEIGERGAQLSGGERQRIAVARAFLKDAPILILDEPTSSIDSKTEAVILDALDKLMLGRTTFIVAHRLSTIRNAEKILVIERGALVEHGTHDELLARGGLYKQLHDMQTKRPVRTRIEPTAEEVPA